MACGKSYRRNQEPYWSYMVENSSCFCSTTYHHFPTCPFVFKPIYPLMYSSILLTLCFRLEHIWTLSGHNGSSWQCHCWSRTWILPPAQSSRTAYCLGFEDPDLWGKLMISLAGNGLCFLMFLVKKILVGFNMIQPKRPKRWKPQATSLGIQAECCLQFAIRSQGLGGANLATAE